MIIEITAFLIALWIIVIILIPVLTLPNFYFRKLKKQRSRYIKKIAKELKSKSKEKTLENIFNFVTENYIGNKEKYKLWILYHNLFKKDATKYLKNKNQFLACHQQNFLISTLLHETNQFTEEDIRRRFEIAWFHLLHQYLIIKVNKKKFKVDPFFKILKLQKT